MRPSRASVRRPAANAGGERKFHRGIVKCARLTVTCSVTRARNWRPHAFVAPEASPMRIARGRYDTDPFVRILSPRAINALVFAAALLRRRLLRSASAQALGYAPVRRKPVRRQHVAGQ